MGSHLLAAHPVYEIYGFHAFCLFSAHFWLADLLAPLFHSWMLRTLIFNFSFNTLIKFINDRKKRARVLNHFSTSTFSVCLARSLGLWLRIEISGDYIAYTLHSRSPLVNSHFWCANFSLPFAYELCMNSCSPFSNSMQFIFIVFEYFAMNKLYSFLFIYSLMVSHIFLRHHIRGIAFIFVGEKHTKKRVNEKSWQLKWKILFASHAKCASENESVLFTFCRRFFALINKVISTVFYFNHLWKMNEWEWPFCEARR